MMPLEGKTTTAFAAILACLGLLTSCGGAGSSGSASESTVEPEGAKRSAAPAPAGAAQATIDVQGRGPKPKLHYPSEPPRHVVVRVLREGSGPRLRAGDNLAARYVGGNAKTKFVQDFWSEESPYRFRLGGNALGKAWVVGLEGMRLGGRRELIVPSRLAYGDGMWVYVIEPLDLEKRNAGSGK
jgi:peptidylprolyl isomerase